MKNLSLRHRMNPLTLTVVAVAILLQAGCTTMQTTYFRGSFQPVDTVTNPAFEPYSGESRFREVGDMAIAARDMYDEGYALIGYSQFVSPLFTSLAPSYATKYAATLEAEYAVMETPQRGASNLHAFLVTYWSRVRPEAFRMGAYAEELPDQLLSRLGAEYNVVFLRGVVDGTPAAVAGLERDDVVLAVDGLRVESLRAYNDMVKKAYGEDVVLSVSRRGDLLDIPVDLTNAMESRASVQYFDAPWRNTAPRDWSMLSAANITANVVRQQQQERERQAAYERGRLAAMEASANLQGDYDSSYRSFASERSARASGQQGGYSRMDRVLGVPKPSAQEWSMSYGGFLDNFTGLKGNPNELDGLDIWFKHAPNIYGQLYTFPRPQVY